MLLAEKCCARSRRLFQPFSPLKSVSLAVATLIGLIVRLERTKAAPLESALSSHGHGSKSAHFVDNG